MKNVILLIVFLCGFIYHALACSRSYTIDTSPCVVGDVYTTDICGLAWDAQAFGCSAHPDDDPISGFLGGGSVITQVVDSGSYAYPRLGGYVYAKFNYYVKVNPGFNAGGVYYSYSAYFYFYDYCFRCPYVF